MSIFKAQNFEEHNIGKRIKSTKKRLTWRFELDKHNHQIDLYLSKLSGKIKIILDGDIKLNTRRYSEIDGNYPLKIRTRTLYVYQIGENDYDIRVGKLCFYNLLREQEKVSAQNFWDTPETRDPFPKRHEENTTPKNAYGKCDPFSHYIPRENDVDTDEVAPEIESKAKTSSVVSEKPKTPEKKDDLLDLMAIDFNAPVETKLEVRPNAMHHIPYGTGNPMGGQMYMPNPVTGQIYMQNPIMEGQQMYMQNPMVNPQM